MFLKITVYLAALILLLPQSEKWAPDSAKAMISFTVKGPFGKVTGHFSGLNATIVFDEKNIGAASVDASIDPRTVSTGVGLRNRDLKEKEEWFDTNKFKEIRFSSKKFEKTGKNDSYTVSGALTIKGLSKAVVIPFTFSQNGSSGVFKGDIKVNRGDFKLGKPGGSVGEEVAIHFEIPVKK